jgi:hypothetical protein
MMLKNSILMQTEQESILSTVRFEPGSLRITTDKLANSPTLQLSAGLMFENLEMTLVSLSS